MIKMASKFCAVFCVIFVASCAQVQIELGSVQNGRDLFPKVDAKSAFEGNREGLTQGEAIIIAKSDAGIYTSTSPESAELSFFTLEDPESRKENELEEVERYEIVSLKFLKDQAGNWTRSDSIKIESSTPSSLTIPFQIIAFNNGDAPFNGDLSVLDRLGGDLKFSGLIDHHKVRDARTEKAVIGSLPYVGILALAIDDFTEIEGKFSFNDQSSNTLMDVRFNDVSLEPGEGILVEFNSIVDVSRFIDG